MKYTPIALTIALALGCGTAAAHGEHDSRRGNPQAGMQKPTKQSVMRMIEKWEKAPRFAAQQTLQKYGPPAEATPTRLIWFGNGPWKRTVITNEPTPHDFPMPHQDVMEQTIDYRVPPDKIGELAAYDGSVTVDRTRGEMSARCDMEAANFIALNLAHDVVTGKRTVDEARKRYGELVVAKLTTKQPVPYAEKLAFEPRGSAGFPDKTTIAHDKLPVVKQQKRAMMEKVLDSK